MPPEMALAAPFYAHGKRRHGGRRTLRGLFIKPLPTENAAPDGTAFSVCVLLGEREKSHKDWLPFG